MPVSLGPVGPNPVGVRKDGSEGELQVFSRLVSQKDDQNQAGDGEPIWHAHTDYSIYNLNGKLVQHVDNTIGHYAERPTRVALPAGTYLVKAQAQDYLRVEVLVTIAPGRTTSVHLDDKWKPSTDEPKKEVATAPNGNPVGWLASSK
jgi:hypothetical protein